MSVEGVTISSASAPSHVTEFISIYESEQDATTDTNQYYKMTVTSSQSTDIEENGWGNSFTGTDQYWYGFYDTTHSTYIFLRITDTNGDTVDPSSSGGSVHLYAVTFDAAETSYDITDYSFHAYSWSKIQGEHIAFIENVTLTEIQTQTHSMT